MTGDVITAVVVFFGIAVFAVFLFWLGHYMEKRDPGWLGGPVRFHHQDAEGVVVTIGGPDGSELEQAERDAD